MLSPEELARWCQQTLPEDTRAFEHLVTEYKVRVFATAYRMLGNRQDAEDLTQDVFVKVFRGIHRLEDPTLLTAWITRITVNSCLNIIQTRRRRPVVEPIESDDPDGVYEVREVALTTGQMQTPEEMALRGEEQRCIGETMAQLDANVRTVLVLRDVEERSYDEIAHVLEMKLSAVKMRIHRARIAFQRMIAVVCPETAQRFLR